MNFLMDWLQALILGVVQGITEFLPISSTAHIRVVPALLGWEDPGAAYTAVIQLGTLLAVFIYFWRDLVWVYRGWLLGLRSREHRTSETYRVGWALVVGTVPIVVGGLVFEEWIEKEWRSLWVIVMTLAGMGGVLWFAERYSRKRRKLEDVRMVDGLIVGVWQALALVPGVSRSGSTLSGALLLHFERSAAARFSFLLSVPAVLLSGVYEFFKYYKVFTGEALVPAVVGVLSAFVSGYLAIDFLIKYLRTHSVGVFVVYRLLLALFLFLLLQFGFLFP
ncbi:MAG: undecaprenyl-diphosphate phosphatase [Fimbriimonadales bacterium]|nr:undecaprenyl-diphosphate phosphatase [Fimbriimonadales bacterium]